jgi:hypothetical protein
MTVDDKRSATVTGPITGGRCGRPFMTSAIDLQAHGYTESEYFIEGHAHGYRPAPGTTLSSDGRWSLEPTESLPYKTRLLVRRPDRPDRFNGTVVVEWLMSVAGFDVEPSWHWHHPEYLRGGYIWIGISPKHLSVDSRTGYARFPHLTGRDVAMFKPLVEWDPERYGELHIPTELPGHTPPADPIGRPVPGIELSFDIVTQAVRSMVPSRGLLKDGPLAGYDIARVIAVATTDGAAHYVTYYNGVQPIEGTFDGYFLESRGVGNFRTGVMPLGRDIPMPEIVHVRTDLSIPMILVNQDYNTPFHFPYRQPDADWYRFWEVAGTAHMNDFFNNSLAKEIERDLGGTPESICGDNRNTVPYQYAGNAALRRLVEWIDGTPAPSFPPVAFDGRAIGRDAHGNTVGGLRLPQLTVPAAVHLTTNSGCQGTRYESGPGSSIPLAPDTLRALHGTPDAYMTQFTAAAEAAVVAGILLADDIPTMIEEARAALGRW